jgi:hypothetical protein
MTGPEEIMRNPDDRHFEGAEAERILRRAVEIDEGSADGFDLRELREIAAEVGVSPVAVERAVLEVAPGRRTLPELLAGGPASFRLETEIRAGFGKADGAQLLAAVDAALERSGRLAQEHGAWVWRTRDPYGSVVVSVGPSADGRSFIRATADRAGAAQMTWILSGVGALVTAIAVQNQVSGLGAAELIGVWSAAVAAGAAVARGVWSRMSRGWQHRMTGLIEEMRNLPAAAADRAAIGGQAAATKHEASDGQAAAVEIP